MVINISSINELSQAFDSEFKSLTIVLDSTYGTNGLGIHHTFREERVLVDCVRFYSAIWSVRQNLNLYIANLVNDTTEFCVSWGDIFYAVTTTKKMKQKNFLKFNVPFIEYINRAFYDFSLDFDDSICRFEPRLNVFFQAPYVFGKPKTSTYTIFSDYFMSMFCFWYVYTSQALMVAFHHSSFKNLASKVDTFKYRFSLTLNLESKDDRFVLIQPYDMNQDMRVITVNNMYQKFFAG